MSYVNEPLENAKEALSIPRLRAFTQRLQYDDGPLVWRLHQLAGNDRAELRRSASAFIDGLLSGVVHKTGWQLAEQAGLLACAGPSKSVSSARRRLAWITAKPDPGMAGTAI